MFETETSENNKNIASFQDKTGRSQYGDFTLGVPQVASYGQSVK